jgi:exodeoxyribonuclease V alpha subunit
MKLHLSNEQETAVEIGSDSSIRIYSVTGGAGTGKTTVLGQMHSELRRKFKAGDIVLVAPTGRAAKRIQELTGIMSCTIHRLLEFPTPEEGSEEEPEPKRNMNNRINQRVVIVDEASMLGPTLYLQLMEAMRNDGIVRFFGDNNQLPPIESGVPPFVMLLNDHPAMKLTYNYRSEDAIVGNSIRILNGSIPKRNEQFEIIYTEDPIRQLYHLVKDEGETFATGKGQIIMPRRKGNFGTQRVNPTLQQLYNPNGPLLRLDRLEEEAAPIVVRANDRFLWTKNDYNINLFNGDLGVIETVDPDGGDLILASTEGSINVPARVRGYSSYHGHYIMYDPRKAIDLGYAITTHKSQGSEFHTIVYVICKPHTLSLNINNFYTAITRAKQRVVVIADRTAMRYSLSKPRRMDW